MSPQAVRVHNHRHDPRRHLNSRIGGLVKVHDGESENAYKKAMRVSVH